MWEKLQAAVHLPPALCEQDEVPGTGTGRTWSSRHPNPHNTSVKERLSGTGWLKKKQKKERKVAVHVSF